MKSNQTIIRKNPMEQLHFITKLLDIKDPNIQIMDVINRNTHKEIIAKLDYERSILSWVWKSNEEIWLPKTIENSLPWNNWYAYQNPP